MFELAPAQPSRGDLDWCWYLRRLGKGGETLERALHDIGVLQPGGWAYWQDSKMTDTGAPVEMMFIANQSSLSLRTEVEDPAKDPAGRVAKACDLMMQFGGTPPPAALRDVISAVQGAGPLRFGAWLGLHSGPDGLATTLYAEVPAEAADLRGLMLSDLIAPVFDDLGSGTRITMLGYHSQTGEVTLYCETDHDFADAIPKLVAPAEVPAEPLVFEIGLMLDAGVADARQKTTLQFNYALHDGNVPPTLTLLLSSKAIFEHDTVIADRVKNFPGDHVAAYTALTDQLLPASPGKAHHGDVGFLARKTRGPLVSIGVAAPWACPFEDG
ncbi:hypothetical protein MWU60_15905 [Yoonia sp. F2084L]|uniref:hypothetical protein n=1 Tax=Yoonia sp. F2084L TaxID=2926419 RepID=UPI001FF2E020|nr:hypothetical protein [Yoonia sp. F2084L]MCK0097062.1 hypothetical protein [Yoonia sp. F2084L]